MGQTWDDYNKAAERGPGALAVKIVLGIAGLVFLIGVVGYVFGWVGQAANVAQEQLGPRALLDKYTWLKDAHAQLDKKKADIKVYASRTAQMDKTYEGVERAKWAREDREQYNLWQTEVAGVKASYNDLAAQYNAKMAEVQWRFTNVGQLPAGATEPLPREYAPYVEQ